jgi:peptidoglycan/xylan/chitin deacetylase (PgdA/CDA1 family)
MIQRAAAEGHTVAVHTATHRFNDIYASEEAFFQDFEYMQSVIESYTGQKPMILRFPGGSSNTISNFNKGIMTRLVKCVKDYGLRYFDWNVDSGDAGGAGTTWEVFQNVVNGIGNMQVAVVLQHDTLGYSVDAVEQIILWGIENGYTFAPLTMDSPACEHPVFN